jgi:CRP-like cAMP-binding protein
MDKNLSLLQETELFRGLSEAQVRKIFAIGRKVDFPADATIMTEGDIGDTMYIIGAGTVEVVKTLVLAGIEEEEGLEKNKVFTRLGAEQHAVFGEIALLEEAKRTATIRAITDVSLYEIRKDAFLRLAGEDPALGYRIMYNLARIVSARLRKADEDTIKLTTALSLILKETAG